MSLSIRKEGNKNFGHYDSDFLSGIRISGSDMRIEFQGNNIKLRTNTGQIIFQPNGYLFSDVTVYDDTASGNPEVFASISELQQRLIDLGHPAFYEDGSANWGNIGGDIENQSDLIELITDLQTSYTTSLVFDKNRTSTFGDTTDNSHTQTAQIIFTYDFSNAVEGSVRTLEILSNGDSITIPTQANKSYVLLNNSDTTLTIINNVITPENGKRYFFIFWYTNGYVNCIITDATVIDNDTTPPVFTTAPNATNITETSFDIEAQMDENGTVYAVVVADGATAPTSTEVKNGTGSGGSGELASGNDNDTGSGISISLSGLTASTDYDVYVVGEDENNNLMVTPTLVNVTTASSYVFANTKHMLIDASGEGMTVTANNLLPSDGAGTDQAVTFELWYKTPSTMSTGRLYTFIDDGGIRASFVAITGANNVYFRFEDNGTSDYIQCQSNALALSASTLYHIVGIYDGSESNTGMTLYINNDSTNQARTSAGTYNGIQTDKTGVVLHVPRTDAAIGLGEYQIYRQFNSALTPSEITTLYNSGTPIGLNASLQAKCVQENLFEGNLDADNIGTNGVAVGTPTFPNN